MSGTSWTVARHPSRATLPRLARVRLLAPAAVGGHTLDVPWYMDGTCDDPDCAVAFIELILSGSRAVTSMYASSLIQDVTDWLIALREIEPDAPEDSLITVAINWDNWGFSPTLAVLALIRDGATPHHARISLTAPARDAVA